MLTVVDKSINVFLSKNLSEKRVGISTEGSAFIVLVHDSRAAVMPADLHATTSHEYH